MKMFIPSIGDKIELVKDWQFPCFLERRNADFIQRMRPDVHNLPQPGWRMSEAAQSFAITLPKKTVLKVDRIYIRQNNKDFDSLSFIVTSHPNPNFKAKGFRGIGRFWAKLVDVNTIEFKMIPTTAKP